MSNDRATPPKITTGSPESFGWQRRPDLDTPAGLAYEKPTGCILLFERGRAPALARLKKPSLRDYKA
jgi:hypothetical protein